MYSVMASESQTVVLPSTRQGTLPVGEKSVKRSVPKITARSRNGMPSSLSSTQGRSDQEE